ncbi:MAG: type III-B CRISPR module-associated protein Cmr5 [bacterium]|nr:type III-B CRISPR module-associated protein Cmr5 [bacterium]
MKIVQTENQKIANICYQEVKDLINNKSSEDRKKYKSALRHLPSMIISNGLLPTLYFYKSRGSERKEIFKIINKLLEKLSLKRQEEDLLNHIVKSDYKTLMFFTERILWISSWLKRIAEAEIDED